MTHSWIARKGLMTSGLAHVSTSSAQRSVRNFIDLAAAVCQVRRVLLASVMYLPVLYGLMLLNPPWL